MQQSRSHTRSSGVPWAIPMRSSAYCQLFRVRLAICRWRPNRLNTLSTSLAAGLPAARPLGRSLPAACRSCCTRCGRYARLPPTRRTASPSSFRSDDSEHNAVGLLHEEMRRLGSLIMRAADANQVPAGGALAVDRDGFSAAITEAIATQPLIEVRREEVAHLPPADWDSVI